MSASNKACRISKRYSGLSSSAVCKHSRGQLLCAFLITMLIAGSDESVTAFGVVRPVGNMFETVLARFGSRYSINVRPQERAWYQSPCGRFYDEHVETLIGLNVGGKMYALPLCKIKVSEFENIHQRITPCKLIWHTSIPSPQLRLTLAIVSPFYPKDEALTLLPAFIFDFSVENLSYETVDGEIIYSRRLNPKQLATLRIANGTAIFETPGTFNALEGVKGDSWEIRVKRMEDGETYLFCVRKFSLQPDSKETYTLILASHSSEAFFVAMGYPYRFKYSALFGSIEDVLSYTTSNLKKLRERTELFENTIVGSMHDESLKALISLAFQSYASNAIWLIPASDVAKSRGIKRKPPFDEWFSVLEGGGGLFNSTVDVEYNISPFYLLFWAELLEMLLREWSAYRKGGIIRHDMGMGFAANGMSYYYDMPVEENTNFILMLFALWASTANHNLLKEHWSAVKDVVAYLVSTDTDGNGFPNLGTSNTVDQGTYVIQHAPEQTYLAMKMAAAYQAAERMARFYGDSVLTNLCRAGREKITATLKGAWLGDHYAVCLSKAVHGWDAYSIYTANGWLLPFMVGVKPEVDVQRLRIDLANSTERTWKGFGSTHTSIDAVMWISQNIWRDCLAAYLGIDMIGHGRSYWNLLYTLNRTSGGAFIDSYNYENGYGSLRYYPRGMAASAYLQAQAALSLNRLERKITFKPLRKTLRIPLPQLADWDAEKIPSIEIGFAEGKPAVNLTHRELLEGWEIEPIP
ncbi:MAG: DUF4965 domain-containing protein [Armatimonadota bacterium]|nr:DUF4965 domain-containing protein [Armatimonadota bacterium]MCX7776499.1 DUF4965 domain-containing protein [Armatimonadota bacterium]MDW8024296.1 DUF4965 domain-containing protein [Armatimonadota bacterium]